MKEKNENLAGAVHSFQSVYLYNIKYMYQYIIMNIIVNIRKYGLYSV